MGSLVIALILGEHFPAPKIILCALLLGFIAYGLSIFTYIKAQSIIGAAKTSAFYALAPFIGSFLSFVLLHETLSGRYVTGLLIMIAGSFLAVIDTMRYRHSHIHSHTVYHLHNGHLEKEVIQHEHAHTHLGPGLVHEHRHLKE